MRKFILLIILITPFNPFAQDKIDKFKWVQSYAQNNHVYISDIDQYGVNDKWVVSLKGDCEDYALWIQKVIGGRLLWVFIEDTKEYHMVLEKDGYIFDNRYSHIYKVEYIRYKVLGKINLLYY
jgi:predicted transglutaminase-like cysteine proteinase